MANIFIVYVIRFCFVSLCPAESIRPYRGVEVLTVIFVMTMIFMIQNGIQGYQITASIRT
jgi:hypothetical protein